MNLRPIVSVIIPVRDLSYYLLYENLPAFQTQTSKRFEVIVLPNEQGLYDLTLLKKYSWLRIVPTGKITRPAMKRDLGAKEARGTILAFLDDDAYPAPDWIETGIKRMKKESIAAVGGPGKLPDSSGLWERVFDEILTSAVGSGTYAYRFASGKKRYVDDYPSMNFLVRKAVFDKVGGFNSDYWPGEDSKLCNDIVYGQKKRILYDPSLVVFHHRRNALRPFLRQHANYGFHRGAFFAHGDANSKRLVYLLPSLLVICIAFTLLSIPLFLKWRFLWVLLLPFSAYMVFVLYIFFKSLFNTKNLLIAFLAACTLALMHVTYGILFFVGFLKGTTSKANIYG